MTGPQTVTLSLFRYSGIADAAWAFGQMGLARRAFAALPTTGFVKQLGTGVKEGFTPRPNWSVYGVIAAWPSEAIARETISDAQVFRDHRGRAAESWTLFLQTRRVWGAWAGGAPFQATPALAADSSPQTEDMSQRDGSDAPIVVLTRAQVKLRHVLSFWSQAPAVSDVIGENQHVLFKIGLGEVPFRNQVTFSIWPDAASIHAFAYADGAHARAIKAVRQGDWFSEELYARFALVGMEGSWSGAEGRLPRPIEAAAA